MKAISKSISSILLIIALLLNVVSCGLIPSITPDTPPQTQKDESFYINGALTYDLRVGDAITLDLFVGEGLTGEVIWTSSDENCATVSGGVVSAIGEGVTVIKAILGNKVDRVIINVSEPEYVFGSEYPTITIAEALSIAEGFTSAASTEIYYIVATVSQIISASQGEMTVYDETGSIYVYKSSGNELSISDLAVGDILIISGTLRNYKGKLEIERGTVINFYTPGVDTPTRPGGDNTKPDDGEAGGNDVVLPDKDDPITSDPYLGMSKDDFYANYQPAVSYMDSYYRSLHNFMSGGIDPQDQKPTISSHRPTVDGMFVRNNEYIFSEDGNTYFVVDAYGEIVMEIYKGGAYVLLEEVAAYVFAFGEPPANHSASKSTKPTSSPWGIYLRVNNTVFSGSTTKYPYEPELPRISGCGGDLTYYEMDIGTTGTDCDPGYDITDYNNGYSITRGAARIVYSAKDRNGNRIIDLDERYVFYTYNHYNDFQEYLNYYGGWGEMFGNVTGGGTLSSKYDYNPTPYVQVVRASLKSEIAVVTVYYYVPKEEYAA